MAVDAYRRFLKTRVPKAERPKSLAILALLFASAGALHFVAPEPYIRIVPPWLPNAPLLVAASGVAELAGAAGLLFPPTRRAAGWGLIALLVAVLPANVHMLQLARAEGASGAWQALLWARLPMQPLLIWWIWRVAARGAGSIQSGTFPASWYAGGADCGDRPHFQVHAYNADLYILRQAACTSFEKPFLYLIFGDERALLLDTGAGNAELVTTVNGIISAWLGDRGRESIELIVAHSHGHDDHVAGDAQFAGRPRTTIVGRELASVQEFFAVRQWPDDIVQYDLGARVLDVIPIPGHEPSSIALYDRRTALLLTGDTVYPGRLYVRDPVNFARSIRRLVDFTRDRPVAYILGTHIENTRTPFCDYPEGTVDQPNEHPLELTRSHLVELDTVLERMRGRVEPTVLSDLTISPVRPGE